jgi:predicted ATPase
VIDAPGLAGTAPEWLAELTRLLPELRRRFPDLPAPAAAGPGERWSVFEGTAQAMLSVAAERPIVFFIDDLQWCDGETCALLHFLSRRFERCPVAVVASLTLGELDREAPPARLVRALRALGTVVTPGPLTEGDVWQLVREMGRIPSASGGRRLAHRLHEVTDGNPFHVIELIKTLFAQGLLVVSRETGAWMATVRPEGGTLPDVALPSSVEDAILQRVARLPYELRDLLATIAIVDRGASAELLSHVHGMSRLRVAALGDALVERRLLVEERGLYRCAHSVIADVVRRSLTPARRREVHRAVALAVVAIADAGDAERVAGEIARQAERGGERALAYRYALLASGAAADRHAFDEALYWLDLAADAAADGVEADEVKQRTGAVLQRAGWSAPPPDRRPRGRRSPPPTIEGGDLDVGGEPRADP